jgi:hypothetical protein
MMLPRRIAYYIDRAGPEGGDTFIAVIKASSVILGVSE